MKPTHIGYFFSILSISVLKQRGVGQGFRNCQSTWTQPRHPIQRRHCLSRQKTQEIEAERNEKGPFIFPNDAIVVTRNFCFLHTLQCFPTLHINVNLSSLQPITFHFDFWRGHDTRATRHYHTGVFFNLMCFFVHTRGPGFRKLPPIQSRVDNDFHGGKPARERDRWQFTGR